MSILDDMLTILQAAGVGTPGTNLFKGRTPPSPDAILVVQEYPGEPPSYTHDSSHPAIRYPRVQVSTRAAAYDTAEQKIQAAYDALSGIVNTPSPSGAIYFLSIRPLGEPGYAGVDENNRVKFVCNFEVKRRG